VPKVYVGNLATSVTSHDLRTHFARAGEVLAALAISDKVSGLCRGFGFVEMADLADVAVAFSLLNHTELNGRRITIEPHPALANGRSRNKAVVKIVDASE
jgi:RNA recognition motif-containing protein